LPRATSKLAAVIGMLRRPEGATLMDLVAATGWLPHTTRAALTGVRKRGYVVALDRSDRVGGSVYRIEAKLSEGAAGSSEVSAAAT
jgi:DNA-binding IclR family transcriptional regulator